MRRPPRESRAWQAGSLRWRGLLSGPEIPLPRVCRETRSVYQRRWIFVLKNHNQDQWTSTPRGGRRKLSRHFFFYVKKTHIHKDRSTFFHHVMYPRHQKVSINLQRRIDRCTLHTPRSFTPFARSIAKLLPRRLHRTVLRTLKPPETLVQLLAQGVGLVALGRLSLRGLPRLKLLESD